MNQPVLVPLVLALCLPLAPRALHGSDHADPIVLTAPDSGLTGLFAFPDGDRLVLILATHPRLSSPPPYDLESFEFAIHLDLHSRISFTSAEDRARYGGTVVAPEGIGADVTLAFRLDNDASLASRRFDGLESTDDVQVWTGVRDDPFIFPRFFGTNVIAMVVSLPETALPAGQRDLLLWGTATKVRSGRQVDHVGRSNRTQLARFDFLNTLPPSEHLPEIHRVAHRRQRIGTFLGQVFMPLEALFGVMFPIRHYDYVPDVMIYTTRYPPGYPNGRLLTDDVVLLTCQVGECLLMEAAFTDTEEWPRQTVNDKEFLAELPYLAEPWPDKAPPEKGFRWGLWITILVVLVVVAAIMALGCLLCRWAGKRRAKRRAG